MQVQQVARATSIQWRCPGLPNRQAEFDSPVALLITEYSLRGNQAVGADCKSVATGFDTQLRNAFLAQRKSTRLRTWDSGSSNLSGGTVLRPGWRTEPAKLR